MKRSIVLLAAVLALTPVTAGCASTTGTPQPSTSASKSVAADLTIENFTFSSLSVKAGATFTVHNSDSADHTLNIAGTNTDAQVNAGATVTVTAPSKAGSYNLSCDFHKTMHGVLVVTN